MQPQTGKRKRTDSTRILSLSGGIFLLLFLSALIVACGGAGPTDSTTTSGLTSSAATTTIHLGDSNTITVPTQTPYSCVAWATQTSPAANNTTVVGIYAKYIHNVDGNPEGVEGATANARVDWGAGNMEVQALTPTTKDGLAVFKVDLTQITNPPLNKEFIVTVTFTKDGQSCTTDRNTPAYFTLIMVSPTADSGTPTGNGNNATPTCTPKKRKKQQC